MLLVDLSAQQMSAVDAAARLESAHIAVSSLRLPQDPPAGPSYGLRLGTPAITTRGFDIAQMDELAELIDGVLRGDESLALGVRERVTALCRRFPVYGPGSTWGE